MLNRQMASRVFDATDNFCVRSRINYQYLEQVAATLRLRPIASRVSRRYYHKGHGVLDNDLKIRSMGPAGTSVGENSLRQFTPGSVLMPKASRPRYCPRALPRSWPSIWRARRSCGRRTRDPAAIDREVADEGDTGPASRFLRRRRARHRDRRAGAAEIRAAGLRAPRDRAQQARGRKPQGQGRACSSRTCPRFRPMR